MGGRGDQDHHDHKLHRRKRTRGIIASLTSATSGTSLSICGSGNTENELELISAGENGSGLHDAMAMSSSVASDVEAEASPRADTEPGGAEGATAWRDSNEPLGDAAVRASIAARAAEAAAAANELEDDEEGHASGCVHAA